MCRGSKAGLHLSETTLVGDRNKGRQSRQYSDAITDRYKETNEDTTKDNNPTGHKGTTGTIYNGESRCTA